ncbi:MAG: J domain-containing protein [Ignavibacteriales bacterium]|nr:J domain-containing protein [Ignavibacteriales bacterium]
MSAIEKMREVADLLISQRRYKESYTIYDELYRQIWGVFGTVQGGLAKFSSGFLGSGIGTDTEFRRQYTEPAANALCEKMYNIDLSLALNEFVRIIHGHLQCICYSRHVSDEMDPESVLSEFHVLYVLVLQPSEERRITPVFAVVTALVDENNRFKKLRSNYMRPTVERALAENAQRAKTTEWKTVNHLLLDYLLPFGGQRRDLVEKISKIVGPYAHRSSHRHHHSDRYEKYERYERYERYDGHENAGFDPAMASDNEKTIYYGKLLGLRGRLTKAQIRTRYVDLVGLYHPDKVQHLGPELKELAEAKTKEINAAYEWLKSKYRM